MGRAEDGDDEADDGASEDAADVDCDSRDAGGGGQLREASVSRFVLSSSTVETSFHPSSSPVYSNRSLLRTFFGGSAVPEEISEHVDGRP